MTSARDDPFGVFEDSSDSSDVDDEVENGVAQDVAETEEVSSRGVIPSSSVWFPMNLATVRAITAVGEDDAVAAVPIEAASGTIVSWDELQLPWHPPLLLGPMKIVSSLPFGGGRGCVAERHLAPGTLLLVEEPLATWSVEDNRLDLDTLITLFGRENASQIVQDLEHFHPTKRAVDDVVCEGGDRADDEQVDKMMSTLRAQYSDDPLLPLVIDAAKERKLVNTDGSELAETDVLRLLLALRYNGLESGIFCYAAMLNHADQPNCVKFLPAAGQSYSEVRTTRAVAPGQALTISYVPRVMSHASRRRHLWEQHRFDIGPAPGGAAPWQRSERVQNRVPVSALDAWDEDSPTRRVERTVAALDGTYHDAVATLARDGDYATVSALVQALEQASLALCTEAEHQLGNAQHVLLVPCRRLHLDACDLVQRDPSLRVADRLKLLSRLVETACRLLRLQKMLLGPDHFDVARTNLDLAQGIDELLSRAPQRLLNLRLDGLSSISAWSALECKVRRDYERIAALYPRDVAARVLAHQQENT